MRTLAFHSQRHWQKKGSAVRAVGSRASRDSFAMRHFDYMSQPRARQNVRSATRQGERHLGSTVVHRVEEHMASWQQPAGEERDLGGSDRDVSLRRFVRELIVENAVGASRRTRRL